MKKIILWIVIIAAVLFFGRNVIAKMAVEQGTRAVTGLPLSLGKLDLNFDKTFVEISDLKLSNPQGFEDDVMLAMPEILVDYDLPAIFKGKVHLEELTVNLDQFVVIKNSQGQLNLDSLKAVQQGKKEGAGKAEKKEGGAAPQVGIDKMSLKVGKVIFKDYSKGGAPVVKEFKINLNEHYDNITNLNAVVSLIVVKALSKTTVAALANFDVNDLQGSLSNVSDASKQLASGLSTKAGEKSPEAKETVEEATAAIGSAAKNLKNKLFGGDSN